MPDNQTDAPPPIQPLPPANPAASAPPDPESRARTWNMLCHLSVLSTLVGLPFGNLIGPLVVWQIKKDEIPSVNIHGKAALNFQITVTIAVFIALAAMFVGAFFCFGWLLFPVPVVIGLCGIIFPIIAGIKASNGEDYKYPWSLELVK